MALLQQWSFSCVFHWHNRKLNDSPPTFRFQIHKNRDLSSRKYCPLPKRDGRAPGFNVWPRIQIWVISGSCAPLPVPLLFLTDRLWTETMDVAYHICLHNSHACNSYLRLFCTPTYSTSVQKGQGKRVGHSKPDKWEGSERNLQKTTGQGFFAICWRKTDFERHPSAHKGRKLKGCTWGYKEVHPFSILLVVRSLFCTFLFFLKMRNEIVRVFTCISIILKHYMLVVPLLY